MNLAREFIKSDTGKIVLLFTAALLIAAVINAYGGLPTANIIMDDVECPE